MKQQPPARSFQEPTSAEQVEEGCLFFAAGPAASLDLRVRAVGASLGPGGGRVRGLAVGTRPGSGYGVGKPTRRGKAMSDSVYSVSEIVGSSTDSIEDAIRGAVGRASKTLHNLDWFQVSDIRGRIEDNERCHFQVTLKVGFRLDQRPG
jgi:flavin-binding protein dodecin